MAIRKRQGRASPFQVFWNNPFTGKRESKCFRTLTEAERHDSLIKHKLKHEREDFRPENYTTDDDTPTVTLDGLCFLYMRAKVASPANTKKLISHMRPLLAVFGHMAPEEIQTKDIRHAMQDMRESGSSPGTVRTRFAHLKAMFRWGVEMGIIESYHDFRIPNADHERIPPPSPRESALIFEHAAPHLQRVVLLGVSLGVRIGEKELFSLKWQDVDLDMGFVRVWSAKKNPKAPWRDVPIKDSLLPIIRQWRIDDGLDMEYVIHFRGKPVRVIRTAWAQALKRAGITRRIRPYDLRHAFATEALAAGADIRTIAELMGHADVTMILRHYQHVLDRQKKAAVEAVPDILICAQENVPKQ